MYEFASVYDVFMEDVPYDKWYHFIKMHLSDQDVHTVCELGCGTGQMTTRFAKDGKTVIGLDVSPDMLMIAQDRAYENEVSIFYSMQDITKFELGRPVDFIFSCCDSLNYILTEHDLFNTFKQVNAYLSQDKLFIFDLNTEYKYKELLGEQTFADCKEKGAYIWNNYYDEETGINEYEVHFFIRTSGNLYERTTEVHKQRAYSVECVRALLSQAGFKVLHIYDNYTMKAAHPFSERVTYIAKKG